MRVDLPNDPAVYRIAAATQDSRFTTVGRLHAVWSWAGKHAVDGRVDGASSHVVDDVACLQGFAEAMTIVGWLRIDDQGIEIPDHDRHNGHSARERTLKSERQARWRAGKAAVKAPNTVDGRASTDASTREEKRREEISLSPGPSPEGERAKTNPVHPDAESAAAAMRSAGLSSIKASRPELSAWLSKGVTVDQLADAAREAATRRARSPVAYAFTVVADRLAAAAGVAAGADVPSVAWDSGRGSIEAKGIELGLGRWNEGAFQVGDGETFAAYTARVRAAIKGERVTT